MTIHVLVNGARGRMGQQVVATVDQDPELTLVGQVDRGNNLASIIDQFHPDVVIDFTTAAAVFDNASIIIDSNTHPVIGTTGLHPDQIAELQQQCATKKLGGLIAPNFSIGAILMMKYAQDAARYLQHAEIIELHHDGKLDSPSGTSIKTAEMIAKQWNNEEKNSSPSSQNTHETIPGARGATYHDIPIHAVRLPGLVAHQEVIFGGIGETFHLRHNSINRECFMPGVLLACKKVMTLKHLEYGLEHIL